MAAKAYDFRASPKKVRPLSLQRGRESGAIYPDTNMGNNQ